jgi:hypothetical protein
LSHSSLFFSDIFIYSILNELASKQFFSLTVLLFHNVLSSSASAGVCFIENDEEPVYRDACKQENHRGPGHVPSERISQVFMQHHSDYLPTKPELLPSF